MLKEENASQKENTQHENQSNPGEDIHRVPDLKEYDQTNNLSLRDLNFGLWLANNRKKIRGIFIIILIIISAGLFIYSAYNYVIYFKSANVGSQLINDTVPQSPRKIVNNLQISPLNIFNNYYSGKSDLVVRIFNPNAKFSANFEYCFSQTNKVLVCKKAFILPNQKKYIFDLSQVMNSNSQDLKFKIKSISWRRIDLHQIPNWTYYLNNHLNFSIKNIKFTPAQNNSLSQKIALNSLNFSIQNQSPYGYYQVPLNILFFSGNKLVGVNQYFLENFFSGEERKIEIVWTGNLSGVDRTEIEPDLNLLSDGIYLPYRGIISN